MLARRLLLPLLLCFLPTAVSGQSLPKQVQSHEEQIQELRAELEALEKRLTELQSSQTTGSTSGARGARGPMGPPGPPGPQGPKGESGKLQDLEQIAFGDGYLKIQNDDGQRLAYFGTSTSGGGIAQFHNSAGEHIAFIGIDDQQQGNLTILGNGSITVNGERVHDYAEVFDLATRHGVRPGTVLSVAGKGPGLAPSSEPYDPAVVGVVSGAGSFQPGLRIGSRDDGTTDLALAVAGQVYVRINLEGGPIRPGDLLVTSSEPGVAMRASDRMRAFGAVVGKALEAYDGEGEEGLVRMLVMSR